MTVEQKLQQCRVELQKKGLKKSGKNNYAGFTYFELADFLPVINEMFALKNLFSNFSMLDTVAILKITDLEDKSEVVFTTPVAELELKGCNKIQALGGTHTYLKRYLYFNALEIVESDLFNSISGKEEPKEPANDKSKCPKCGKSVNKKMIDAWGMCAECKSKESKNGK